MYTRSYTMYRFFRYAQESSSRYARNDMKVRLLKWQSYAHLHIRTSAYYLTTRFALSLTKVSQPEYDFLLPDFLPTGIF